MSETVKVLASLLTPTYHALFLGDNAFCDFVCIHSVVFYIRGFEESFRSSALPSTWRGHWQSCAILLHFVEYQLRLSVSDWELVSWTLLFT